MLFLIEISLEIWKSCIVLCEYFLEWALIMMSTNNVDLT